MNALRGQNGGFGLIEVLIALVVFAVGLLGVAGLQIRAQQMELDAYQRAQAMILLQDMVDRLNTNREARNCYPDVVQAMVPPFVGTGAAPLGKCTTAGVSATQLRAEEDLKEWDAMLRGATELRSGANVGTMAGARGCITVDALGQIYSITVAWQGEIATRAPVGNSCAENLYGSEALRRVIRADVRFATLN
jgi:type IV pilus assembly protein PilV